MIFWETSELLTTPETRNILELQQNEGKWLGPVTFTFLQSLPSYYGSPVNGFSSVNAATQAAALRAMAEISSICNVTFIEVPQTPATVGNVTFGFREMDGPGYTRNVGPGEGSDVWLQSRGNTSASPYLTILHELLHAIGLSHPVRYDVQDVGIEVFPSDPTQQFTVMSYASHEGNDNLDAVSLQLYDIAVLQHLYGVNTTTRTGDDTYAGTAFEVRSIWDAGGLDTISAAAATLERVVIDLRQGYFSSLNDYEDLSVAFGAEIENAIGSNRGDTIVGNALGNRLYGGDGNDTLFADEAALFSITNGYPQGTYYTSEPGLYFLENQNDTSTSVDYLEGGLGNDTYVLSNDGAADVIIMGEGNDIVTGRDGFDRIVFRGSLLDEAPPFPNRTNGNGGFADYWGPGLGQLAATPEFRFWADTHRQTVSERICMQMSGLQTATNEPASIYRVRPIGTS
jgi:Peptidase M10 serralysin C terminal